MDDQPQAKISLRRFVMEDVEKVFAMSKEESLARFLPDQVYQTSAEAAKVLTYLISAYGETIDIDKGPFVLGIVHRRSSELIGHIGVSKIPEGVEIGYSIEEKHQGYGYASEAVFQMLNILETSTQIPEIYGVVDPDNFPSIVTLGKCGFAKVGSKAGKLVYKRSLDHPAAV